jgi:hypothetical protein
MLARSAQTITVSAPSRHEAPAAAVAVHDTSTAAESRGGVIALGQSAPTWTSGGISCSVALRIHSVRNASLVWTTPASAAVAVPA